MSHSQRDRRICLMQRQMAFEKKIQSSPSPGQRTLCNGATFDKPTLGSIPSPHPHASGI
ncbi:hypothetical protein LSH36_265g01015 [Paralvinella palmiformis]|uniref:Uncharacterized protein n=1 Tax=Paralvinella palmiformis TaxID=53620 RepID=A0AAD9JK72_9ANNE|nr:hypothetical protein LSH36_265g01015 [Paralvinella palmiformis]